MSLKLRTLPFARFDCARYNSLYICPQIVSSLGFSEAAMPGKKTDLLDLDHQFCFAVYSAAHALNRAYKPLLDALGVTYPQYLVLFTLWTETGLSDGETGQRMLRRPERRREGQ